MFRWGMGQMRNLSEQMQVMTKSNNTPCAAWQGCYCWVGQKKLGNLLGKTKSTFDLILVGG